MSNSNLNITSSNHGKGREAKLTGDIIEITVGIDTIAEGKPLDAVDAALLGVVAAQLTELGITYDGKLTPGPMDLTWNHNEEQDQ